MTAPQRPPHYPVMLDLTGRLAVVVGGGAAALRTVSALVTHGADVVVITPSVSHELQRMEADGLLTTEPRGYVRGDLDGAFLAVASSGSAEADAAVVEEAKERNVLVNVPRDAGASTFIVPSVVERGALQIAVSSGGIAPAAAREARRSIAESFGWEWGPYVELLGELRTLATERTGLTDKGLAPLFAAVAASDVRERILAGEDITAEGLLDMHGATISPAAPNEGTDA